MDEFDIKLEKTEYTAGEEVKGTLIVSTDKQWKLKDFKFSVLGEEITSSYDTYYDNYATSTSRSYHDDIFFLQDLSAKFWQSTEIKPSYEGEFELEQGRWDIPFRFTIPDSALESYNGLIQV